MTATLRTANSPASIASDTLDCTKSLAFGLLIFLVLRTLLFQLYTIPSSSMEPGLQTGDYVFASKFDYGWSSRSLPFGPDLFDGRLLGRTARRGDVVVFRLPRDPSQTYVKRIVGLPGDHVQVMRGRLYVNGAAVPARPFGAAMDHDDPERNVVAVAETKADGRSYVTFDAGAGHLGDDTPAFLVPQDCYFMMGDNRDNSLDSRWPHAIGVGFVREDYVLGRVRLIVASWKQGASVFKPWTWARLETGRFLRPVS